MTLKKNNEININKLKAQAQEGFNSQDDKLYLNIKFNDELIYLINKTVLKKKCFEDSLSFRISNFYFERYLIKKVYIKNIRWSNRHIFFSYDLLKGKNLKIPFNNIYEQSQFLKDFNFYLNKLIKNILKSEIEKEIIFNLED